MQPLTQSFFTKLERTIAAGATTINIPIQLVTWLHRVWGLNSGIKENVPNVDKAIISVHGHNDLGLAVANFLEAVKNGARQLECTINGIGERAGNASLEELVMALHGGVSILIHIWDDSGVRRSAEMTRARFTRTSRLVSNLTGMLVQPNKAVVGANAFAYESAFIKMVCWRTSSHMKSWMPS